jgi:hypothetical protein
MEKLIFVDILKAIHEKSRIHIRKLVVRICGSGSLPKCHTTLIKTVPKFMVLVRELQCKAGYEVGLKSIQAWGCPCSIKCLFLDIKSAPTLPSFPFSYWLFLF